MTQDIIIIKIMIPIIVTDYVDHEIPKVTTLHKSRLIYHKLGKNIIALI